jgi:hypothetical protein
VAVFGGCQIDEGLNGYQLTATDSTDWLSVTSDPFDVLPSPPKTLAISTPPTEEIAGQIWSTQPVVTIEDAEGKPVPSDTSPITLSIAPGTGAPGATLSGCEATTTFGVARFSGCHLDAAGTGFQLIASDNADSLSVTSGAFDVAMAASVTTLTVPSLSETVGEPVTVEVQVASAAPNTPALAPTGLVDVSDGIDTCQGPLTDEGNVALGSCTVTPQAAGFYAFDAIYLGDSNFNPSGVQNTPIVVEQAVSETSIDLSSEMVRYGDEGFDEISVTVKTSPAQIPPSGTITIRRSQRILCASELHDATATCRLPPTALNAGVADIVAAYSGSASLAPSTSPARALTVLKASSKTILHLSTPRAHYGDENVEEISVAVVPEFAGSKPSGTVVVGTSATRGCVIDLRAGTGSCRLGSKRLPAGRYQVVADYAGSIDFRASSSRNGTLTIVAP